MPNNQQTNYQYKARYLVLDEGIYSDKRLTDISRRVCGFIYSYTGDEFFFSNRKLAEMFNCSDWSISKAIKLLREIGYIEVKYESNKSSKIGGKKRFIARLKIPTQNEPRGSLGRPKEGSLGRPQESINRDINTYMSYKKKNSWGIKSKSGELLTNLEVIQALFNFYLIRSNTSADRSFLTEGRQKKLMSRLKTFTPQQLKEAIDKCYQSPWHRGEDPKSNGWKANIDWIIKNDETIDKLLNMEIVDNRTNERKLVDKMLYGK